MDFRKPKEKKKNDELIPVGHARCTECFFNEANHCHRNPLPVLWSATPFDTNHPIHLLWPVTPEGGWCGEWQAKMDAHSLSMFLAEAQISLDQSRSDIRDLRSEIAALEQEKHKLTARVEVLQAKLVLKRAGEDDSEPEVEEQPAKEDPSAPFASSAVKQS